MTVLSFSPNCSHKLQPLDVSVYGSLKTYVNHASHTMTFYDIPGIVNSSLDLAASPGIKAGFQVSGIYPFNRDIYIYIYIYMTKNVWGFMLQIDLPLLWLQLLSTVTVKSQDVDRFYRTINSHFKGRNTSFFPRGHSTSSETRTQKESECTEEVNNYHFDRYPPQKCF